MSDPVTISVIAGAVSLLGTLAASFTAYTTHKTHRIVNGGMLIQLRLHAKTARALANTKETPENLAIAELAEKMLIEHHEKYLR